MMEIATRPRFINKKEYSLLNQYPNHAPTSIEQVQTIVSRIFPSTLPHIERVTEGVSTYVYRLTTPCNTCYLRVLPEEGASFALLS
jgi:hypothetical protein